jgi:polygalacturonase
MFRCDRFLALLFASLAFLSCLPKVLQAAKPIPEPEKTSQAAPSVAAETPVAMASPAPAKETAAPKPHFDPRTYGAKADGTTFDTEALQEAIDACAGTGGSVVLSGGTFLTKPLELRGNMTLHVEKGAVLLGSPDIADYPVKLPAYFPVKSLCRSLLYAENADGLTISGQGEINGASKTMNIGEEIRKVGNEKDRPALLRVFRSPNVTVKDITLRDPCMWTTIFNECDNLLVDRVTVDAPPNVANLSGFEISDSHGVIVRNCNVRCEDDGICFKTFPGSGRGLKNVLVENNTVCSYKANAIKLGFWTYGPVSDITLRNNKITYAKYAGLSLASVHGAPVRNITVDGLEMRNVGQPVFIRLGNMLGMGFAAGNREGKPPGSLEDITISNLRAISTNPDNGPACVISGIPGARIKNVRIKDSSFEMPGGLRGIPRMPPEKEDGHPQSNMFWHTPGYAFFVRHADGVVLENVTVSKLAPDKRPWLCAEDAAVETVGCKEYAFGTGETGYGASALSLLSLPAPAQPGAKPASEPPKPHFDPRTYGAKADGATFDTEALQKAIDACAGTGGSVVLAGGTFLTKPLELRGKMTLHVEKGAVLLGSSDIADYPVKRPEGFPILDLCRSLLYAENAGGLTISGQGEINGASKTMNIGPDIRKVGNEPHRPSLLRVFRSPNVTVKDITFRDPCMWTTLFNECDNLLIDGVTVDAPPIVSNLSGFEISDSHGVIVRNCDVRAEDDGICFKTFLPRGLKNVLVENNTVHCYMANAIKLGSWTVGPVSDITIRNNKVTYAKYAGLNLASVDGSVVKNIVVENLEMHNTGQPLFIRLGKRESKKGNWETFAQENPPGSIDGVTITGLRAYGTHQETEGAVCAISGIPNARIRNVLIKDSSFEMFGGLWAAPNVPAEREKDYPQSNMFGNPPGWAFFVRHADGVVFDNVTVSKRTADIRPWLSVANADVKEVNTRDAGLVPAKDAPLSTAQNLWSPPP